MNVLDYIAHETERQSGTVREGLGMYGAWQYAKSIYDEGFPLGENALCHMVKCINGIEGYRNTPVFFRSGGHAVNYMSIPRAMAALSEALRNPALGMSQNRGHENFINVPDTLTKEFLSIHPFADGNGRVGSLMWNFLRGSLADPEPMPYFFGDDNG